VGGQRRSAIESATASGRNKPRSVGRIARIVKVLRVTTPTGEVETVAHYAIKGICPAATLSLVPECGEGDLVNVASDG
jgi:hypothetical protein